MTTVHDSASQGYSQRAETYATGRPDYPSQVVAWLRGAVGLSAGKTVLDLGSGTGKFLPYLGETGARRIALEPVPAMRAQLTSRNPNVEAIAGTADASPLPDASLDAVTCAQSFHWFASAAALQEIRRVLKPGGILGLIWNVRDESVGWVAELSTITDPLQRDTPRYKSGAWRSVFPAAGFEFMEEQRFRYDHVGKPEQVIVDRTLSVSFIAALGRSEQEDVATRIRALIAATPELRGRDQVAFPYETFAFTYRKIG